MLVDATKIKVRAVSLGEPVTFKDRDAEEFLRDLQDAPPAASQAQLRAAVKAAAAVQTSRTASELLH